MTTEEIKINELQDCLAEARNYLYLIYSDTNRRLMRISRNYDDNYYTFQHINDWAGSGMKKCDELLKK